MGCGGSTSNTKEPAKANSDKYVAKEDAGNTTRRESQKGANVTSTADEAEAQPPLPNRARHMPYPAIREVVQGDGTWLVSCFPHLGDLRGTTFAVKRTDNNKVFASAFTDSELFVLKEKLGVRIQWGSFWKALNNALTRGENCVRILDDGMKLEITLKNSKDPKSSLFPVELSPATEDGHQAVFRYFIDPGLMHYRLRKKKGVESAEEEGKSKGLKEEEFAIREAQINKFEAQITSQELSCEKLTTVLDPLRADCNKAKGAANDMQIKVEKLQRRIKYLQSGGPQQHPLDGLYSVGGARPFQHIIWATPHIPKEPDFDQALVTLIEHRFPRPSDEDRQETPDKLVMPVTDPKVKEMLAGVPTESAWKVMECFRLIDTWDYNCFEVDQLTNGGALFHTAYALLYHYDLVRHFNIDVNVLQNFWLHAQAGYHPNPYHNATHAADVLQITHFILGPGGLGKTVKISKEDQLAALIAAGIHDYDHPGFNNNFHSRTSAYLATLYNDRSILENHHCACIWEMTRLPRYDIFASLSEDQKKEVRDTMVEMLLSTDMGNHAKIFSQFRRRLNESPDWHSRRDDVRLALVMAIKMADISNCGRPLELYKQWANNIAEEFYIQGDTEFDLKLSISPFMDRRKHTTDFSKGQISFMNYIVVPLFESMTEFLPDLAFTVRLCQENKDFWITSQAG